MDSSVTPDTLSYLILGLVVATVVMVAFLGSLVLRYRSYQQDIKTIEQLDNL
jgi:putative effector of murein hydrolase